MGFRDRKKSLDEREKARREARRKALSERLGGRPDQPGRSQSERDEKARRSQKPKAPATPAATPDPKAKATDAKAKRTERPRAEKPKRTPKRRFWQRAPKPKPTARPRRRTEPVKPRAEKPRAEKPRAAEPRAEKPRSEERKRERPQAEKPKPAEEPRSGSRPRGDERRKPSRPKRRRPSREERVKALRARSGSAAKTGGKALRDGAAATRKRAKAAQPKVAAAGHKAWALAAPLLALPFLALAFAERWIRRGGRVAGRVLSAATTFLDRHVTPGRAVLLVAVATAICLMVSQFQDYRGVEVGQPGYIEVAGTVSADQVDIETPRDAHGPWLLILAGIAIAAAVAAAVTRRRALGLVVSAVGVAGLLISLLVDRPEGLDAGRTAVAYSGTNAVLLDGFYAQVAACGVLVAAGLLVALYAGATARGPAKSPRRARRGRPRPRPSRPVAEGGT